MQTTGGFYDNSAIGGTVGSGVTVARLGDAAYDDLPIDPYGSESPAEFFAVISEAFFETPDLVKEDYPAAYEQLKLFYKQDPLARLA